MQGVLHNYFVCANSAQGFINYFPENLDRMQKIYILKGGPGTGKSSLMKRLGLYFLKKGVNVDFIHCSSDTSSLDGVVIDNKIAVVDGTSPHIIEPIALGAVDEYVNLGSALNSDILISKKDDILYLSDNKRVLFSNLYKKLSDIKKIHDEIEKIYIDNIDFSKLDIVTETLSNAIFKNLSPAECKGYITHRFFGALTPDGSVNYIENLTEDLSFRYFIKGRPGTGKSTLLKSLVKKADSLNLDIEIYHCSLDSNSLDMIIIPQIKTAIFDSTPPHELFPSRDNDILLDLYSTSLKGDADVDNLESVIALNQKYQEELTKAREILRECKSIHQDLEDIYIKAVDFSRIDYIYEEILDEIEYQMYMIK